MNKKRWLLIIPILACLAVLYGYRMLDAIRTDTKPPEIILDEQIPQISVSDPHSALLQGITAKDRVDGDVTASLVVESISLQDNSGRLMVSYAAFDRAGNVAKVQREARFTDYESPKFTLEKPMIYPTDSTFDVLSTIGATDLIDGDIQHRIRATSLVEYSIATPGTHDVKFQVTNSLGDTATLTIPVEVCSPGRYSAELELKTYLVYIPKGGSFAATTYLRSFSLSGDTVNLQNGLPAGYTLETRGEVHTQEPGVYPVEFLVTRTIKHAVNPNYDQKYTGHSRLIVVVEG